MRRLRVEYQPAAIGDMEEIYRHVSLRSGDKLIAQAFVKRIKRRCSKIGFVPYGGRRRDDLEDGLRTVPFEHSAIIAYKVEADLVRITNVFYGGRDYEAFYPGTSEDDTESED